MNPKNVFSGRVIFDHLAKTAGQAINDWLVNALGTGCVTPNLIGDHQDLIRKYGGLYSVISAHVHFVDGEDLDPRYQYMTVFREPVDRIISWLYFLVNNHDESQLPDLVPAARRFLDSEGVELSDTLAGSISNIYVRHFCRMGDSTPTCADEQVLSALAAIRKYDVVGIYEDMPLFLRDVGKLIGLAVPAGLGRVNVTQRRPAVDQISPVLRDRIIELNRLDLRLYAEVLAWKASTVQDNFAEAREPMTSLWHRYDPARDRVVTTPVSTVLACTLQEGSSIRHGQLMTFDVDFFLAREVCELEVGIHLFDSDRQWAFGTNSTLLGQTYQLLQSGYYRVSYHVVADLPAGAYTAGFALAEILPEGSQELAWHDVMCEFHVHRQTGKTFAGYSYLPTDISIKRAAPPAHPMEGYRFCGSDDRLFTQVGIRTEQNIVCTGQAGCLIFGPYISLATGHYRVVIRGAVGSGGVASARMDVVTDKGSRVIAESALLEPDEQGRFVVLPISISAPCLDAEVRVWVTANSDLRISTIELEPLSADNKIEGTRPSAQV
ncbi:Wzt carbohydrate-binding domain-containing protein [Paraburkholderia acidicola]|uniref:Wzt carbohydrate-binding domain-containing protein n=1 Tax=Paraburkholderia acidicola TaxID=1912599 RepID=A0ABV1LVH3_9BURK